MDKLPFSIYDFFGYFASGFIILVTFDFVTENHLIKQNQISIGYSIFWIIISYVIGNINANFSAWTLEKQITRKLLGSPTNILLSPLKKYSPIKKFLFPGYFTPLPQSHCDRVITKALSFKIKEQGETLFHHIRSQLKNNEIISAKLDAFLDRYGFSRNMSFALLISSITLALATFFGTGDYLNISLLSLFGSICMFYRFLKFYRQYTYELLTTYPDFPTSKSN